MKLVYEPEEQAGVLPKAFASKYFGDGRGIEETRAFFKKLKDLGLVTDVQSNQQAAEETKTSLPGRTSLKSTVVAY